MNHVSVISIESVEWNVMVAGNKLVHKNISSSHEWKNLRSINIPSQFCFMKDLKNKAFFYCKKLRVTGCLSLFSHS